MIDLRIAIRLMLETIRIPLQAITPFVLAYACIVLLSGCNAIPDAWIKADRATFDAVAGEYQGYVEADTLMTPMGKKLRKATIYSWQRRIEAAEDK